ncbi:GIY-YIG nuclease family protein [Spirosoma rhododendri]|nr:GIY-YIG nuclease family protein [Spirosoma rhododendri]
MTGDVTHRLHEHNLGKTQSTAFYRPWRLVYTEQALNRVEARKREIWLKSGVGKEYLKNWLRSSTDRIDVS